MLTDANKKTMKKSLNEDNLITDDNLYKFIQYINSHPQQTEKMLMNAKKISKSINEPIDESSNYGFVCELCDYHTVKKSNYTRHMTSVKHLKKKNEQNEENEEKNEQNEPTKKPRKKAVKKPKKPVKKQTKKPVTSKKINLNEYKIGDCYVCKPCGYSTTHYTNYKRHLESNKHNKAVKNVPSSERPPVLGKKKSSPPPRKKYVKKKKHSCVCGKKYLHRPSLSRHTRTCETYHKQFKQINNLNDLDDEDLNLNVSDRKFLKNLIKKYGTINQTIHNTQHNQFNLNIFLNETCKDAMNLKDFVNNIEYKKNTIDNLLSGDTYDSFTNMVIDQLNDLDITKRPIHCMDSKRQIVYVKEDNLWDKDNNCEKITEAINVMTINQHKSDMIIINNYNKENPEWSNNMNQREKIYQASKNSHDCINKMQSGNFAKKIMDNTLLDKEKVLNDSVIEINVHDDMLPVV